MWEQLAITVTVFLPLVGAGIIALIPKAREEAAKPVAFIVTLVALVLSLAILAGYYLGPAGGQGLAYRVNLEWIPQVGINYHVAIDGISLPLFVLTYLVTFLCAVYCFHHIEEPGKPRAFLSLMLMLQTGMAGCFIAFDLILFFVFWELVLVPMYFVILGWGHERRQYASLKFFREVLGFGLSDVFNFKPAPDAPTMRIHFLHAASGRHHSLALAEMPHPAGCVPDVHRQARGIGVRLAQVAGADHRAAGSFPRIFGRQLRDLIGVAPPVHEMPDPEPREDLRELGGMTERVGCVGNPRDRPQCLTHSASFDEVADVRLTRGEQGVGLHVPRSYLYASVTYGACEIVPSMRADLQVVLEDDRLAIEQEGVVGIGVQQVEDRVDGVNQTGTEGLEGLVPLAVGAAHVRGEGLLPLRRGALRTSGPSLRRSARASD